MLLHHSMHPATVAPVWLTRLWCQVKSFFFYCRDLGTKNLNILFNEIKIRNWNRQHTIKPNTRQWIQLLSALGAEGRPCLNMYWEHWVTFFQKKRGKPYLAQGALQLPKEVVVTQVNSFVVDVINPKLQFLHYFKVVVDDKLFRKLWVEAILDFLCALQLLRKVGLC